MCDDLAEGYPCKQCKRITIADELHDFEGLCQECYEEIELDEEIDDFLKKCLD